MAALAAVVAALLRTGWRSLRGAQSFTGNNIVAVIALMMAAEPADRPSSASVIYLLVGLLWTLPLSQELAQRIPSIRFRLWPLKPWQTASIYAINLLLNPLIVIAVLFGMLSRDRAIGIGLGVLGLTTPLLILLVRALASWALAGRGSEWSPLRWIPRPPGRMGGLVQSHLRELLQLLDVPFAAFTAVGGILYCRFGAKPDPQASVVFGHLVVLLMSTCAQGHVSFDGPASETRLRLLPVSGAGVLLARDTAWLLVTIPLVVGFRPLSCLAAALAALAVGHRTSAASAIDQKRWNFATGRLVPEGLLQVLALASAGSSVYNWGVPAFAGVLAIYGSSLWWYGREWDRR